MSISSVNSGNSGVLANASSNQSQSLKTMLASIENRPTLLDVLGADTTDGTGGISDILDLSSEGQSAADQLYETLASASRNSIQTSMNTLGASVTGKLSATLSKAGIDTSSEIDLQLDSNGNVIVSNDNSQSQKIEDAINNDPELKKLVTEYLTSMKTMAPAIEDSSSSQTDSNTSISQLIASLQNTSQGAMTLAVKGNEFQVSYLDASDNSVVLASSQVG